MSAPLPNPRMAFAIPYTPQVSDGWMRIPPEFLGTTYTPSGNTRVRLPTGSWMIQATWEGVNSLNLRIEKGAGQSTIYSFPAVSTPSFRVSPMIEVTAATNPVELLLVNVGSPTQATVDALHAASIRCWPIAPPL